MERLGPRLRGARAADIPRLVYCSISGFGQTGPRSAEPGYDAVIQGEAGLMSITGAADGPPFRLGVAIADIVSGMFAAQGIALALLARVRTGRGQRVDIGMLDATAALLTYQAGHLLRDRHDTRRGWAIDIRRSFRTRRSPRRDGEFVVAVGNDEQWRRFCDVIGAAALADDERFATNRARVANYDGAAAAARRTAAVDDRGTTWVDASESRRRAVRLGTRRRGSARGSPAGCARDDRNRRSRVGRRGAACSASRSSCRTHRAQ